MADLSNEKPIEILKLNNQSLTSLPHKYSEKYGKTVTTLNLANNQIKTWEHFDAFSNIHTLILDHNQINIELFHSFPRFPTLKTLWINNNDISYLPEFIDILVESCPLLNYLSMLMNPACPGLYFSVTDDDTYTRYRHYLIYRIPTLIMLDATPITQQERQEALRKGQFLEITRPDSKQYKEKGSENLLQSYLSPREKITTSIPKKPVTYLARGRCKYDGHQSEGNRFILNEQL